MVIFEIVMGEEEMICIRTEHDLYPWAVVLLVKHGCVVKQSSTCCEVTLPEGSTRKEILFRSVSERYKLVLPSGLEIKEIYNRFVERSALYFIGLDALGE